MSIRLSSQARSIWRLVAIMIVCGLSACAAQSAVSARSTPFSIVPSAPTRTPAIECVNDAKFIADISVPDGTHLRPGAVFTKTWQLRNTGQCAWTIDYQLKFIGGSSLNETNMNLPRVVSVGDPLDLSIVLTAPITAGQYRARWRLFAADGAPFGPTLFADITVP